MPCLGCTEPEFPFFELAPGTVFKTQTVMGIPKELPLGVDKKGYIALTGAAKTAAPAWAEQDIFVV
jgi:Ni,Fe-hydrogenase I small subunit